MTVTLETLKCVLSKCCTNCGKSLTPSLPPPPSARSADVLNFQVVGCTTCVKEERLLNAWQLALWENLWAGNFFFFLIEKRVWLDELSAGLNWYTKEGYFIILWFEVEFFLQQDLKWKRTEYHGNSIISNFLILLNYKYVQEVFIDFCRVIIIIRLQ